MSKKSNSFANKSNFRTLIPEYSDAELIKILKMRNHYQPEAVSFAIEEAIRRGLIDSEQNLLAEEYRVKPLKNTFFPIIENEVQRKKISKSIIRGLIISGVTPGILGVIRFFDGNLTDGLLLVVGSIIWLVLSAMLFREVKHSIIKILFVFVSISVIYVVKFFITNDFFRALDFFIPIIFYCFLVYGLIFLKKINEII